LPNIYFLTKKHTTSPFKYAYYCIIEAIFSFFSPLAGPSHIKEATEFLQTYFGYLS